MTIVRADMQFYYPATIDDTASNGGELTSNQITSGVSSNIFPTVPQAERLAGSTKWRKVFATIKETTGNRLLNSMLYIENPTPADDAVYLVDGTLTDTQGDLSSPRVYGCGWLNADVLAGASQIVVRIENAAEQIFQVGDKIRISDMTDVDDSGGNEEFHTILTANYVSDICTIDLDGTTLTNGYSSVADATRVASVLEIGTIEPTYSSFVLTSTGGTYDDVTFPVLLSNPGTVRQNWSLDWIDGTSFNITGDTLGNIGTGTIVAGAAPVNAAFSAIYFNLQSGGFGGTFVAADNLSFTTLPAAYGIWLKRVINAATASFTANKFVLVLDGESD